MLKLTDLTPTVLLGIKALIILAFVVYLIFSLIFLQKVRLLSKIVETQISPLVSLVALLNLILTVVFLLAAILLI